jgi:hypothetical protein
MKVLNPIDKDIFLKDLYFDIEDLNCTNIGQVDEIRLEILNEINIIILRSPEENSHTKSQIYSFGHLDD